MKPYSKADIDKIGNAFIFFAERNPDLSKTKLLKLLYLTEETFIRSYNVPAFGLEFKVWQAGPVARDIYIDLSDEPSIWGNFISLERTENATYIKPKIRFSDGEFSDNELEMMTLINDKFGKMTAKQLVDYTHRETSLWYQIAKEKGLLEVFKQGNSNSSDEKIDFTRLLDKAGIEAYNEQVRFKELVTAINS
ncbi:MAG: type II toxin-antitoxin system antitoxin SocA domain-containing protein [Mangrovibacterium sp.]